MNHGSGDTAAVRKRMEQLKKLWRDGTAICLETLLEMLQGDKECLGNNSPLRETFELYCALSGQTLEGWGSSVRSRAGNQVLIIELLELIDLAIRWEAIYGTLDYDYGDEYTLTSLAIREKLTRIDKIIRGEDLMMPTPLKILRAG